MDNLFQQFLALGSASVARILKLIEMIKLELKYFFCFSIIPSIFWELVNISVNASRLLTNFDTMRWGQYGAILRVLRRISGQDIRAQAQGVTVTPPSLPGMPLIWTLYGVSGHRRGCLVWCIYFTGKYNLAWKITLIAFPGMYKLQLLSLRSERSWCSM